MKNPIKLPDQLSILHTHENTLLTKIQETSEKSNSALIEELKDVRARIKLLKEPEEKIRPGHVGSTELSNRIITREDYSPPSLSSSSASSVSTTLSSINRDSAEYKKKQKTEKPESLIKMDDSEPEDDFIPDEFFCSITHEIMQNPVMTVDGQSYEQEAIKKWFARGKTTSPLTNEKLSSLTLIPNRALQRVIRQFQESKNFQEKLILHQKKLKESQKQLVKVEKEQEEIDEKLNEKKIEKVQVDEQLKKMENEGRLPSLKKQGELCKKNMEICDAQESILVRRRGISSAQKNTRLIGGSAGGGIGFFAGSGLHMYLRPEPPTLTLVESSTAEYSCGALVSKIPWKSGFVGATAGALLGIGLAEVYNRYHDKTGELDRENEELVKERKKIQSEYNKIEEALKKMDEGSNSSNSDNKYSLFLISSDEKIQPEKISATAIILQKDRNNDSVVICWFNDGSTIKKENLCLSYLKQLPFPAEGQPVHKITPKDDKDLIDKVVSLIHFNKQRLWKPDTGKAEILHTFRPDDEITFGNH